MSIVFVLGMLVCIVSGSSHVFVLKGEDVHLDVQKPNDHEEDFDFTWKFKSKYNVVKFFSKNGEFKLHMNDRERVEFSIEDFSLRLKNLQEADSGVYTALISGEQEVKVAEYNVTVQGSSHVFVLKGEDVRLDVQKPFVGEEDLSWKFKSKYNVVRFLNKNGEFKLHMNYRERVEFSIEDFSLRLKNLQEADSGVYTALISGEQEVKVAEYNVTVQEPVSPVVKVHHVSFSSDSCNLTVSCSDRGSSISSTVRCDTHTCSQEGGERSEVTNSVASLYVYLSNDSIICNHSNHVSSSEDMKNITSFCWASPNTDKKTLNLWWISLIVVGLFAACFGVCAIHYCRKQRGRYDRKSIANTVYDTPQNPNRGQAVDQNPSADTSLSSPTSTYSMIGPHTAPKGPNEIADTVYAKIERLAPKRK